MAFFFVLLAASGSSLRFITLGDVNATQVRVFTTLRIFEKSSLLGTTAFRLEITFRPTRAPWQASLQSEENATMDNTVVTALYTWYNFLPRNLYKQFQRRQNSYFLLISMMQVESSRE